jgi:hypothetical protein
MAAVADSAGRGRVTSTATATSVRGFVARGPAHFHHTTAPMAAMTTVPITAAWGSPSPVRRLLRPTAPREGCERWKPANSLLRVRRSSSSARQASQESRCVPYCFNRSDGSRPSRYASKSTLVKCRIDAGAVTGSARVSNTCISPSIAFGVPTSRRTFRTISLACRQSGGVTGLVFSKSHARKALRDPHAGRLSVHPARVFASDSPGRYTVCIRSTPRKG